MRRWRRAHRYTAAAAAVVCPPALPLCASPGRQVAGVIGADAKEIIFTSGATESNNLAIKGVASFYKDKKNHVITTQARIRLTRTG